MLTELSDEERDQDAENLSEELYARAKKLDSNEQKALFLDGIKF